MNSNHNFLARMNVLKYDRKGVDREMLLTFEEQYKGMPCVNISEGLRNVSWSGVRQEALKHLLS